MIQQINLYQPIFRQQKKVFSAVAMFQVLAVVLLAFAIFSVFSYRQKQSSQKQLADLEAQHQAATAEVEKYKKQFPVRTRSVQLEQQIARRQRQLADKNLVIEALKKGDFGNTEGFSGYLEGLSRQAVSGAWINRFSISSGGKSLALGGSAVQPELVPVYLQQLSDEQAFRGMTFDKIDLTRSEQEPWKVNFRLYTREAQLPDDSDG